MLDIIFPILLGVFGAVFIFCLLLGFLLGLLAWLASYWPDRFSGALAWLDDHTLGPVLDWFAHRRLEHEAQRTGDSPGRVAVRRLILMCNYRLELGESPQSVWDALIESQQKVVDEMGGVPHLPGVQRILYTEFCGECEARGLIPPVFTAPENPQST